MPGIVRLETLADDRGDDPRRLSVAAQVQAVLDDGRRIVLLDGRGWTEELRGAGAAEISDIWADTPAERIAETARVVVGPDEPFGSRSPADMETDHWNALARAARAQGVSSDGEELRRLRHDVVLSDRLLARLGTA